MVFSDPFKKFKRSLPDVSGKTFVITGTTSGTGLVAAQVVAERGGEVVLLNRQSSRSEAAIKKLQEAVPKATFVQINCDLQDFASVKAAAQEIKAKYDKIYCLANNAGIMGHPDQATKDGYDTQMQSNHLSHFLLTAELLPLIAAGAKEYGDARVVQHSSGGRHGDGQGKVGRKDWGLDAKYLGKNGGNLGGNNENDMDFTGPNFQRYFQSKLANSVFMHGLDERFQKNPDYTYVKSVAAQPGIANTGLMNHVFAKNKPSMIQSMMFNFYGAMMFQTSEQGSMGLLTGMMGNVQSGNLYGPVNQRKGPAVVNAPQPYEHDPSAIKLLWDMSEEATGVKIDI